MDECFYCWAIWTDLGRSTLFVDELHLLFENSQTDVPCWALRIRRDSSLLERKRFDAGEITSLAVGGTLEPWDGSF